MEKTSEPLTSSGSLSQELDPDKEVENTKETVNNAVEWHGATEESGKYLAGFKLLAVTASITITAFLLFLDQSILGTVCLHSKTYFYALF